MDSGLVLLVALTIVLIVASFGVQEQEAALLDRLAREGRITSGMTPGHVRRAWGPPARTGFRMVGPDPMDVWWYEGGCYVVFFRGRLIEAACPPSR